MKGLCEARGKGLAALTLAVGDVRGAGGWGHGASATPRGL